MALTDRWNDEPAVAREPASTPAVGASLIDRRIAEYDAQLALVRDQLDAITAAYRRVTAAWLADWYAEQAKRAITEDPAATDEMPDDVLADLRAEVVALVDDAPAIVDELLADEVWPHRADAEAILTEPREMTLFPVAVDLGQRRAMGRLGAILASRGLARVCDASITTSLSSYDWVADGADVHFASAVIVADEAKAIFLEYCRLWPALQATVADAEHVSLTRKRSEVIDRWERLDP